jgi:hypothetical protein
MRNGDGGMQARTRLDICLACGGPVEEPLRRLGSLRCMDCRESQRPLDPSLADGKLVRDALSAPAGLLDRLREDAGGAMSR